MWLQYHGFTDAQAAIMMGTFVAGEAVGSVLGGYIADRVSRTFFRKLLDVMVKHVADYGCDCTQS